MTGGRAARDTAAALWLPALLVVVWWVASSGSRSIYFPPLRTILAALGNGLTAGPLVGHAAYSLGNLAMGLLIATVLGVGLGLLIAEYGWLQRILDPLLQFARAVPQVALVPIVIGVLGIGAAPKIFTIALGCVWPVLLNTIDGARGMETGFADTSRAYRLPAALRFRRVVLPGALPQIMAGIRVSLAVGVVIMIVSELFGADRGLGFFILQAGRSFDVANTWAGTLLVGVVGYVLSTAFALIERIVLRWYFASTSTAGGSS